MSYFGKKNQDKKDSSMSLKTGSGFTKPGSFSKTSAFSKTAGGFIERLKKLSKKDVAMVLAGVTTLAVAPVAEHFLSKPSEDNLLTSGFGSREPIGSTSVYEPGINSLSVGSPEGAGDVITPLSVRDPLSLIVGRKKRSASPKPVSSSSSKYRDTLKDVAKNAFSSASRSAGAPVVIPKMQGGLRSLGSFMGSGGTRTSGIIPKGNILSDAKSASSKAARRSAVGSVASADYKGVAATPKGSSKDTYEQLRSKAGRSASHFTDGSAVSGIDKAAAEAVSVGSGGSGYGKKGDKTRRPSNSSIKNSRNNSGETLSQLAAKQRQAKALEWEFYKKYDIRKQIFEAAFQSLFVKGFMEPFGLKIGKEIKNELGLGGSAPPKWACYGYVLPIEDPEKGKCFPAESRNVLFFSNEKEITSLDNNGRCPCGKGMYRAPAPVPTPGDGTENEDENIAISPGSSREQLEIIDSNITAAVVSAKSASDILNSEGLSLRAAGNKLRKEMKGIVGTLREAKEKAFSLASEHIAPKSNSNISVVRRWTGESEVILNNLLAAKSGIKKTKEKIRGASKIAVNEDEVDSFNQTANACRLGKNHNESVDAVESMGADAQLVMIINCQSNSAYDGVLRVHAAANDIADISKKTMRMSERINNLADENIQLLSGIDMESYDSRIDEASKKFLIDPDNAKKEMATLFDELATLESDEEAIGPLAGGKRDAPGNVSVLAMIIKITGIKAKGAEFDDRTGEESKAEIEWWNKNDPFVASNRSNPIADENKGVSLVRLSARVSNFEKNISDYKKAIPEAKELLSNTKKNSKEAMSKLCGSEGASKGLYSQHEYCGSGSNESIIGDNNPGESDNASEAYIGELTGECDNFVSDYGNAVSAAESNYQRLPEKVAEKDDVYQSYKTNADAALMNMKDAMSEIQLLKTELVSPDRVTKERAKQIKGRLSELKTKIKEGKKQFNKNYPKAVSMSASNSDSVGGDNQAGENLQLRDMKARAGKVMRRMDSVYLKSVNIVNSFPTKVMDPENGGALENYKTSANTEFSNITSSRDMAKGYNGDIQRAKKHSTAKNYKAKLDDAYDAAYDSFKEIENYKRKAIALAGKKPGIH